MRSFYDVTREELAEMLSTVGADGGTLSRRLFREIYRDKKSTWSTVGLPNPRIRAWLREELSLELPPVTEAQVSSDSSNKIVMSFADGLTAEAIVMPWSGRKVSTRQLARSLRLRANRASLRHVVANLRARDILSRLRERFAGNRQDLKTVCLSTQVGCAMGCTFCFTGTRGLKRNLDAGEIVVQLLSMRQSAELGGVVFMGMGEPLHNFENLVRACRILQDPAGLAISGDRIHVSTSGLVPAMDELSRTTDVRLALSLNATTDAVRSQVMPVNNKWPIRDVIDACHRYVRRARGPVMIEYVLLAGVNDSEEDSRRLVDLLRGLDATIQLIPFNEFAGAPFRRPGTDVIDAFRATLAKHGVPHVTRFSKAADVAGACGQLGLSVAEGRQARRRRSLTTLR